MARTEGDVWKAYVTPPRSHVSQKQRWEIRYSFLTANKGSFLLLRSLLLTTEPTCKLDFSLITLLMVLVEVLDHSQQLSLYFAKLESQLF